MAWYDIIIVLVVLLGIFLIVASKITKQTITEMIGSFMIWMKERKEDSQDNYLELTTY